MERRTEDGFEEGIATPEIGEVKADVLAGDGGTRTAKEEEPFEEELTVSGVLPEEDSGGEAPIPRLPRESHCDNLLTVRNLVHVARLYGVEHGLFAKDAIGLNVEGDERRERVRRRRRMRWEVGGRR